MSRSVWLTRFGLTLLSIASLGVLAVPAEAATTGVVSVVEATKVRYKAGKGRQNKVVVTRSGRTITVDDQVAIKAGAGCKAVKGDKTKVRCKTRKAPTRVRVYTYDRNDTVVNKSDLPMTADGGTAKDRLTGGPRADRLLGGDGADTIHGLAGSDYVDGGPGNDVVRGGSGGDTIMDASGNYSGNDVIYGDAGDDWIDAVAGNDKVYGGYGMDFVQGGPGRDRLDGGYGDDTLIGDDESQGDVVKAGIAADVLLGGPGVDLVDYSNHVKPVKVDLDGASGDDGQAGERDTVGRDVENLVGGMANDRLTGNGSANQIFGLTGGDIIRGGAGNDLLYGMLDFKTDFGPGKDGRDTIYGEAGDDRLFGVDDSRELADRLDAGANTAVGDDCQPSRKDTTVNCER